MQDSKSGIVEHHIGHASLVTFIIASQVNVIRQVLHFILPVCGQFGSNFW